MECRSEVSATMIILTARATHAGTACARRKRLSPTSSDVRSLVPLDLLGRTGPARLRLRVRFGVTDDMPTLSVGLLGPVWIFGVEVSSDPSVGYSGVRAFLSLGRKHQDRQKRC